MYGFEVVKKANDEIIDEVLYFSLQVDDITFAQIQAHISDNCLDVGAWFGKVNPC